jgi:hypothetical protein
VAEHQVGRRLPLEGGELRCGLVREPDVVGIEEREVRSARRRGAAIARGPGAGAGLTNAANSVSELSGDRGGTIARPVVDDDDLVDRRGLGEHAGEGLAQIPLAVMNGNDNAYGRLISHDPIRICRAV